MTDHQQRGATVHLEQLSGDRWSTSPSPRPDWVPFAEARSTRTECRATIPPLLSRQLADFFGQTIAPGQTADSRLDDKHDAAGGAHHPDGKSAEVSQVRVEISPRHGFGDARDHTDRDMSAAFTDPRLTARSVPAFCALAGSVHVGRHLDVDGDVALGA